MEDKKEQLPLDAKLLSLAIIELNISRRNVAIYPENHPSIRTSISKAFKHLQELFEMRNEITLAIAKDTLIIDEYALDKKNPVYIEFATSLYKMGIASVTFLSGITEDEITRFHRIITTDMEEIRAKGGVEEFMAEAGITHIRVGTIDYSAFHFVEGRRDSTTEQMNIWEEYVYGLMEGKLLSGEAAETVSGIPPEVLAEMVNRAMPEEADTETYDRVITSYLHRSAAEKRLKKGALGNVMNFIEGLKPSLKKQFLAGTFRQLSNDPQATAALAENMTSEQLMAILREINERDEIIPETLKNLLEKFSQVKMKAVTIDTRYLSRGEAVIDDIQLSPEAVKLFEEESRFQDYVTEDYKRELQKIMEAEFEDVDDSYFRVLQQECYEEKLDRFLTELLIEFLDSGMLTPEEIELTIAKFREYINLFLQTGQFDELTFLYDKMLDYATQRRYTELAENLLNLMTSSSFVEDLMASYRFWGRKNREEVIEFSKRLKGILVNPLLDAVAEETNTFLRHFYLSLLVAFGEYVIPFARERLSSDERWFVKRNMLYLLRECGNKSVLKDLKPYCTHSDIRLALEAMKAYLKFNATEGYPFIRHHLQSKKIEVRDQVIKMIGTYKVERLVPDLLKLLIKKDFLGGDHHLKIPIVKALGEIGDRRAIRYLVDIVRMKSVLYRGRLEELKIAIFKTMGNYPPDAVRPLVEEGLKSSNEEIVRLCEEHMQREGYHAGKQEA